MPSYIQPKPAQNEPPVSTLPSTSTAAGSARRSFTTPISPSLLNDPAFSSDPRSNPFLMNHYQRRTSTGNMPSEKVHNLKPPTSVNSSSVDSPRTSDSLSISQSTSPSSTSSHKSTTAPTPAMLSLSTTPPGSPIIDSLTKYLHRKSPPPYEAYEEQISPPVESKKTTPKDIYTKQHAAEPPIRPPLIHTATTPEMHRPVRPPAPPRPFTTSTLQDSTTPSHQLSNGRRLRALDRIDELDETDPLGLPWHHRGPYEAIGQPSSSPVVYHHKHDTRPPSKRKSNKHPPAQQAVFPDLTLNGTVGVSLNLTPGQIVPRIPIPGYGYGYGYDPRQPSPQHSHRERQPSPQYFPKHLMPPSGQNDFDPYAEHSGPPTLPQAHVHEQQNLATHSERVDTQERRAHDSHRPRINQQPVAIREQPTHIQQPAQLENDVTENFRLSEAYGGLAEPESVPQQPQHRYVNVQEGQGISTDVYEQVQRHVINGQVKGLQDAQNSNLILQQVPDTQLRRRPERTRSWPNVQISPNPLTSTTEQFHNPILVNGQHQHHPTEPEYRNMVGFYDVQIPAGASQRLDDRYQPELERRNPQAPSISPSDVNIYQQKLDRRNPPSPHGPRPSVPYDTTNRQRQAADHQSLQSSQISTFSSRSSGSNAPQPHYLPKRLVMPTPLQSQPQPLPQQRLAPQPQQPQPPPQSHFPMSHSRSHSQPRAQDIPMASRKVLRKRTSTGVDPRHAPPPTIAPLRANAPLPTHVPTPINALPISSRVAFAVSSFGMVDPVEGTQTKQQKAPKRVLSKRRNDL